MTSKKASAKSPTAWITAATLWLALGSCVGAQTTTGFRWIDAKTDAKTLARVQDSFRDELTPDAAQEGPDAYEYKYIDRVGLLNNHALVIVGHQNTKTPNKGDQNLQYSTAFNFNIDTREKSKISQTEWMWNWKYMRLAHFQSMTSPDVLFTYFTCSECEPDRMLNALYYDSRTEQWLEREWGDGKDLWWTAADGLVVGVDIYGGTDTVSFNCLYGVITPKNGGLDSLAIRCKEVTLNDDESAKINDSTVLYHWTNGKFSHTAIADEQERVELTNTLCRTSTASLFCKLPRYMTDGILYVTKEMFPNAPKSVRELKAFRSLKSGMTMAEIVSRCGAPDEIAGSGFSIFIYHLMDGSLVVMGSFPERIDYVMHIDESGKSSSLLPKNVSPKK